MKIRGQPITIWEGAEEIKNNNTFGGLIQGKKIGGLPLEQFLKKKASLKNYIPPLWREGAEEIKKNNTFGGLIQGKKIGGLPLEQSLKKASLKNYFLLSCMGTKFISKFSPSSSQDH